MTASRVTASCVTASCATVSRVTASRAALPVRVVVAIVVIAVAAGCRPPAAPVVLVDERGVVRPLDAAARAAIPAAPVDASFHDTLRLLGVHLPDKGRSGETVQGTLWWLVEREPGGRRPKVLVRARVRGADAGTGERGDHAFAVPAVQWAAGDVLVDRFRVALPVAADGDVVVSVGVAEGDWRWRARAADRGAVPADLVDAGVVAVVDARPPALAQVPRARGAIVVDGVLSEPDWQRAAVLPLSASSGRGEITRPTTALLLWSPDALWLAFRAIDPDPFSPYEHDDDPLYDGEALELFVDADGDARDYVELQAAPTDRRFDAAFSGGRRQGMDITWNANHVVKTRTVDLDGQPGFIQEWRVPVARLKDIPVGEPRVGARWRLNLFRLERLRAGPGAKVTATEGSAWSPPLGGDFHNLARFGTVEFVEVIDEAPAP